MKNQALPILVIDDDVFQRRMIRIKLQTRGHDVNEASDGVEALGFLAQQSYSLVLLDIVMPQLNGWEVLDQIRATTNTDELPVIMMTGIDNSYDLDAARERGATDYLTKPIDFAALNQTIDGLLNKAEETSPTTDTTPANEAAGKPEPPTNPTTAAEPDNKPSSRNTSDSLLEGVLKNITGVIFRAIGDDKGNVQLSYQSDGLHDFMGQKWNSVRDIISSSTSTSRSELNRQFREHGARQEKVFMQFAVQTPNGCSCWAECRATPHRLPSGETVWDGLLLDFTSQKKIELEANRPLAQEPAPAECDCIDPAATAASLPDTTER